MWTSAVIRLARTPGRLVVCLRYATSRPCSEPTTPLPGERFLIVPGVVLRERRPEDRRTVRPITPRTVRPAAHGRRPLRAGRATLAARPALHPVLPSPAA